MTSHNGSQNVTVKVEEGPEPISFTEIKAESEVSYGSVFSLLHISQPLYPHMSVALLMSLCA